VRTSAALLALFLAGCADGIEPFAPPVAVTYSLRLGDEVVCNETLVRMGLPNTIFQLIGWAKRTWTCELRRKTPSQVEADRFRK
jgi:hypothetical protein